MLLDYFQSTVAVLFLVAANGFFVAAEFALVKVRRTRIDQLAAEGRGAATTVQFQLEHLDHYIAATQLGITLASLALGWVGEPALARLVEPMLALVIPAGRSALAHTIAVALSFSLITALHIVLGELVPKSIALQRAETTALWVARPLYVFNRLFRPVILFMNAFGNLCVRLLGFQSSHEHASIHSVEELEMLVAQSRQAGMIKPSEEQMLRRVFDFGDKRVSQIMMPRPEVEGVSADADFVQLIDLAAKRGFTRFPVYEGTLDNVVGFLNIKDLFEPIRRMQRGEKPVFKLKNFLRPVIRVPGTVPIDHLLTEMQQKQVHMAVVFDEYGGTAGIVTFEDVVEELVGEVRDELDVDEAKPVAVHSGHDNTVTIAGTMSIPEFNRQFGTTVDEAAGYDTIAGYVLAELRRAATVGDRVSVPGYAVQVDELDDLRIARLKITPR
jgi:putative hemolysin